MRDKLLDYPVLHCDETRLQVLHEPGRDPSAQSWMWVQSGGPPDKPVILFDYTASRAQEVPLRLLDGVVCGRGRNPTLRLWPTIFSGKIDVFPGDRRSRLISSMTSVAPA